MPNDKTKIKKSTGALFPATKTTEDHPIMTGPLDIRFEDFQQIAWYLKKPGDAVRCKIAAWRNVDYRGVKYLTIVFQPPYGAKKPCTRARAKTDARSAPARHYFR
jgi:hypothetical protein